MSNSLRELLVRHLTPYLEPGFAILDIGAGRMPTLLPEERPAECRYVALDRSADELDLAPSGVYDDTVVADARRQVARLAGGFDLVVSCHVLEHVKPVGPFLGAAHSYLKPGGRFISLFSGAFSAHGLANRLLPSRVERRLVGRLTGRDPDTVFHAHYDRCWPTALERLLHEWRAVEIVPFFVDAQYFAFSRPLQRLFVDYENWAMQARHRSLASHFIVDAER
jgi:SAM-dependent methyltransferase